MIKYLIQKDIINEYRSKESIISMITFTISLILIIAFLIDPLSSEFQKFLPGLYWLVYLFSSTLGFSRLYSLEKDNQAYNLLLLSPIDRGDIFLSKMISFWIFISLTQMITLPIFSTILNFTIPQNFIYFVLFLLMTNWSISAIGTTISAIGLRTKMSEVLIPMLLYPLLSPIIISAVQITENMLKGYDYVNYSLWIMVIFTCAIFFTLTGYLTFDTLAEE
tara:strand:+ start:35 stop:697 length:663 start_codon:yes stop_codon:yes gene_type:complete